MLDGVESLLNFAAGIWGNFMDIAIKIATADPTSGVYAGLHNVAKTAYNTIADVAISVAVIFYFIGLIKIAMQINGDENGFRRILEHLVKIVCMYCLIKNMMKLLDNILIIGADIASKIGTKNTTFTFDVTTIMDRINKEIPFPKIDSIWDISSSLVDLLRYVGSSLILLFFALIATGVVVASAITIINVCYQRIVKPLVVIPFAGISAAMSCAEGEFGSSFIHFIKTFIGFALTSMFIVIAIRLGTQLASSSIFTSLFKNSPDGLTGAMYELLQFALAPMITAGTVKCSDSIISRLF